MTPFFLLSLLMTALVVFILIRPLTFRSSATQAVDRRQINLQSARSRLNELELEYSSGAMNKADYEQAKIQIESIAADDLKQTGETQQHHHTNNKLTTLAIILLLPLLSGIVYWKVGFHEIMNIDSMQQTVSDVDELNKLLADAENKILNDPNEIEGRIALAQVYAELERYSDAAVVYQQLDELQPGDPDILVNYAEALARSHNNNLAGKPASLLQQALSIQPNHGRALWLSGFHAMQSEDKTAAITYWQTLLDNMESGTEAFTQIEKLINDVESDQFGKAVTETENVVSDESIARSALSVSVSIKKEIANQMQANSSLFIFAKAANGPPMPLAVYRGKASELPVTVTLDDSMAMLAEMKLSRFNKIIIGARITNSEQAQGKSGDLEGFSDVIDTNQIDAAQLVIDSIKP